jgi:predicted MFS family arabinose efflux permease
MALCIAMMAALLWMPALLGALSQGFGLGTSELSKLASAELVGFLLATLFTSSKTVPDLKRWLLIGCSVLIAANVVLLLFAPRAPFLELRLGAGLGSGVGFGYALKVCALSERPTRSFGILTGSMSIMMIVGFQAIANLISIQTTIGGAVDPDGVKTVARTVFGIYAALAAVAAIVYLTNVPPAPATSSPQSAAQRARGLPEPLVLLALLAIVLSFIGQGSVWAFLQTLGVSHGFSIGGVANAMSAFAIIGVVGSFAAAALPPRTPRWFAIGVTLLVLCGGLYALYAPRSLGWYVVGCGIGGFYWNFALPLILGLLARIDHTGRGSVIGGTMSSAGSAIGPLLAGLLIQGANYQPVGWMAGTLCFAGLACVYLVERRSRAATAAIPTS